MRVHVWLAFLLVACGTTAVEDRSTLASSPPARVASVEVPSVPTARAVDVDSVVLDTGGADGLPRFRLPTVEREQSVVWVLLYHRIGWGKLPRPAVTPKEFRQQLTWLRDNDVEVIRMEDLLAFLGGDVELPARSTVITIDDGEREGYTRAYPILTEYGVPFTLGIVSNTVEEWHSHGTMQWHQIREMLDSGLCELAAHSHTHPMLPNLSERRARHEIEHSRGLIEEQTGVRPRVFFYPMGAHSERVRRQTAEAGYAAGFVAIGGRVTSETELFRIPRYAVDPGTSLRAFASFFRRR